MGEWNDPPWGAPLDGDAVLRAIPKDATMTGVFLGAVAAEATARGVTLPSARPRYTAFQLYPLREHCALLLELARLGFADVPLRIALRKLGRGAPLALVESNIGRIVFGSAEGTIDVIRAMAKSYQLHMRPCSLEVEPRDERSAIIHMTDVHNFLDSHNVGVFEGVLRFARVQGVVRMQSFSRTAADLLCEWDATP
jgi:hypothetical protein